MVVPIDQTSDTELKSSMLGFPNTFIQACCRLSPPMIHNWHDNVFLMFKLPPTKSEQRGPDQKKTKRLQAILQLFGLGQDGVDIRDWVILQ